MNVPLMRSRLGRIIFETDTKAGKAFDIALLIAIVSSFLVTIFSTVEELKEKYETIILYLEWFFTILFSIEYLLRLWTARKPLKYIISFYGLIDLLSIIPTYAGIFISGTQTLTAIRTFRLIRVFKVFNLYQYTSSGRVLLQALQASRHKITVFLVSVLTIVTVVGTIMYFVEGAEHGFTSIPRAIYWTIVTITTVGYGDIAPETPLGQTLASILMILGYAILAVPTGIVSAELTKMDKMKTCPGCGGVGHRADANFCHACGEKMSAKDVTFPE